MQDKLRVHRAEKAGLLSEWSELGKCEAALNTVHSSDILSYMDSYAGLHDRSGTRRFVACDSITKAASTTTGTGVLRLQSHGYNV